MKLHLLFSIIFTFFIIETVKAQTEFAAGTITEVQLSGDYEKTGFGFDFKAISYPSDIDGIRISTGFISYPTNNTSLLGVAIDGSSTLIDSILISSKIRRQAYRINLEYLHFFNGGYNYDMNFYSITGVRLVGTSQRYRKGDYDDFIYQIPSGQERNGFDLNTQLNLGLGYELAIDFFDFIYLELETGIPLFNILDSSAVENTKLSLGINFGFRTNFGY